MVLFLVSHLILYVPESLSVSGDSITDWIPVLVRKTHYFARTRTRSVKGTLIRQAEAMTYIVRTTSEPLMKWQREYLDVCSSEMVSLVPVHRFKLTGSAEPKRSSSVRHVPLEKNKKLSEIKLSSINNLWSILKNECWKDFTTYKKNLNETFRMKMFNPSLEHAVISKSVLHWMYDIEYTFQLIYCLI